MIVLYDRFCCIVKSISLLFFAVCLSACQHRLNIVDPALTDNPQDPGILSGTLDNGFSYHLRSANSSEQKRNIEIRLVVRAGSIHEQTHEQGFAHLLEHVVFRGTNRFSGPHIESLLEEAGLRWGVDVNATTHYGATIYRFSLTESEADLMPDVLALAADFIGSVNFDHQDIEREKKIVGAEWRFRYGHRNFVVDPLVNAALAGSEYKSRPPVGDLATVRAATAETLKAFWRRNYHASNASLVVTGNIVPWELEKLVRDSFKTLPVTADPVVAKRAEEQFESFKTIKGSSEVGYLSYVNPDLVSPKVSVNFISRVKKTNTVDSIRLGFREELLFKAVGHMLVKRLSTTHRCSQATLHNSLLETGQSINSVEVDVSDSDYLTCLQALATASDELFKNGLIPWEYEQLRQSFRTIAIDNADQYRSSSPQDLAARLTQFVVYGTPTLPASLLETLLLEMIDSVSAAEFNNSMAEIPATYKVVFGTSGPTDNKLPKKSLMMLATQSADQAPLVARAPAREILHGVLNPDQLLINLAGIQKKSPQVKLVREEGDYHEWQLSNGARVIFQKDDRYDYVALAAMAPGGYMLASEGLTRAAMTLPRFIGVNGAGGYLQKSLQRLRSEKSLFSQVQVNPTRHGILAYSVTQDVDLMLELVSAYFDEPVIVEPASSLLLQKLNSERGSTKLEQSFWQNITAVDSPETTLNTSQMRQVQSLLFRTPADFTFVIVGNVEPDILARELTRFERHTEKSSNHNEGMTTRVADSGNMKSITEAAGTQGRQRLNVGLFHACAVPVAMRADADLNLQLLSDIIERRLRYDIREDTGLSYQLEAKLLTDTTGDGRRYHQVEYSVSPTDALQAKVLVSSVLNAIGTVGVTDKELQFALKREKKRRRDLSYDYLSLATEMAFSVQNGANVQTRSLGGVSLAQVNTLASCFSSENTTFVVQNEYQGPDQELALD